eukprot:gene34824-42173_t
MARRPARLPDDKIWYVRLTSTSSHRDTIFKEADIEDDAPLSCAAMHHNWTLSDAIENSRRHTPKLPLASFNHVSREVLSLEKSKRFYIDILGFHEIPRPPFDCDGCWLMGYGLNLHLVCTTVPTERQKVKAARIQHFSHALPRVDHIAFLTFDLTAVKQVMDRESVYYKYTNPPNTGIEQMFLFDPDGNVIEISNCAPPVGQTTCNNTKKSEEVDGLDDMDNVHMSMGMDDGAGERAKTDSMDSDSCHSEE